MDISGFFFKIRKLFWNQNRHIWGVKEKENMIWPLFLPFGQIFCVKFENCFGIRRGTFGGVEEKEKIDLITLYYIFVFWGVFFGLFLDFGKFLGFIKIVFVISIPTLWGALETHFLDWMTYFVIKSILTFFWDTL